MRKTKEDLQWEIENLKRQLEEQQEMCEKLENDVDYYCEENGELQCRIDDLENELNGNDAIASSDRFKWRLQLEGLLTPGLNDFIENYLRCYND